MSFHSHFVSLTDSQCVEVADILRQIAEITDSLPDNKSIYGFVSVPQRNYLEQTYGLRLVQFRDVSEGWITDMTKEQQILFILFIADMIESGDDLRDRAND